MTVIYPTENYYNDEEKNRPEMAYNLNDEKKRIAEATEEIKKELWEKWQKRYAGAPIFPPAISNVNPAILDILLSFNVTVFYNNLSNKYNLNQNQRDTLPQIVWSIAINKNWDRLENEIQDKLKIQPQISAQIGQDLNQNILSKIKELSGKPFISQQKNVEKKASEKISITLSQALRQFPQIGEQSISSNSLKSKYFPNGVRPSVKNWIADYHAALGNENHNVMDWSNYLYHSENAKRLTAGERQKLAIILKSLDEDAPINIDPDRREIIFENHEPNAVNHEPVEKQEFVNIPKEQNTKVTSIPKSASESEIFAKSEKQELPVSNQKPAPNKISSQAVDDLIKNETAESYDPQFGQEKNPDIYEEVSNEGDAGLKFRTETVDRIKKEAQRLLDEEKEKMLANEKKKAELEAAKADAASETKKEKPSNTVNNFWAQKKSADKAETPVLKEEKSKPSVIHPANRSPFKFKGEESNTNRKPPVIKRNIVDLRSN